MATPAALGVDAWPLIRRSLADQSLAFFTTWCPQGIPLEVLVRVEGCRWAIEDAFETAKNELGLDHHESRSRHGWHRHVSLVILAFALLAVIRYRAVNTTPAAPKKHGSRAGAADGPLVGPGDPPPRRPASPAPDRALVIAWSVWRRCHQATAQRPTSPTSEPVMLVPSASPKVAKSLSLTTPWPKAAADPGFPCPVTPSGSDRVGADGS